jgi:ABC-type glycerol-3-phosphate transport system substrate-binding protein
MLAAALAALLIAAGPALASGSDEPAGAAGREVTVRLSLFPGFTAEDSPDPATGLVRRGMKNLVADFNNKYPNIKVELIDVPFEGRDQKMQSLYMSNAVDVCFAWGDYKVSYLPGFTVDHKTLPGIEQVMARYPEYVMKGERIMYGDVITTIPTYASTSTAMYDKKLLEDLGLKAPSMNPTAGEIYDLILKAHTVNPRTGQQVYGAWMDGRWMINYLLDVMNDGAFYVRNPDQVWNDPRNPSNWKVAQWSFNTPEMAARIKRILPLTGAMPAAMVTGQGLQKWGTPDNDIAIIPYGGMGYLDNAKKNKLTDRFVATNGIKDGKGMIAYLNVQGSTLAKNAQNRNESWELLKFITGPETQKFLYENYGTLPCLKDTSFIPATDSYSKAFAAANADGRNPTFPQFYIKNFRPFLNEVMAKYLDGTLSGAALDDFIAKGLAKLDSDAAQWSKEQ